MTNDCGVQRLQNLSFLSGQRDRRCSGNDLHPAYKT
jgi:hypothetical protein